MHRLLPGLALLLALTACGSTSTPSAKPTVRSSPTGTPTTYFVKSDSDAVNAAALPAQDALNTAYKKAKSCNSSSTDYTAWRKCWHGLLDPARKGLAHSASALRKLAAKDLPDACTSQLSSLAKKLDDDAASVAKLLKAIDGNDRAAQQRAINHVYATMQAASKTYTDGFPAMTKVCYSPKDLASINASASATPSS